ncbi:hypothetical protein NG798_24550 [Ancylothrix sp. C2]|uniref:hypothetical protein n=1 Tax=Ancylothrix sp. D3o TaxID=2953691 RepID=UPI0021BA7C18|nr:hypothetical protein [Ancylothrix sp. D3o]MCT7952973.1 hypothetical protein [Ancylothrix sp. D3o]
MFGSRWNSLVPVDVERPVNLTEPVDVERPVNLTEPLDVEGPVSLPVWGNVEGPVVVRGPVGLQGLVELENSAFALRLVDVKEPMVVSSDFSSVSESILP